jgi:protein-S-isoprenylcysteine O-methyltransferase Ste14
MTKSLERAVVWAGGGLFVASIALTSWVYALWFRASRPWTGWGPVLFDSALFSVFALHHSLFARTWMKAALAAIVPERLIRSLYVSIASGLLILVCLLWKPIGGEVYAAGSGWLRVLHAIVQLTGLWLIARSVQAIDALELAGIRPAASTPVSDGLKVHGPYGLVRHPLYLGWILIVFGAAHLTGDRLAFAAISSFYLLLAIPWEERSLEQVFGDEYVNYKRQVRWRVLPFLY